MKSDSDDDEDESKLRLDNATRIDLLNDINKTNNNNNHHHHNCNNCCNIKLNETKQYNIDDDDGNKSNSLNCLSKYTTCNLNIINTEDNDSQQLLNISSSDGENECEYEAKEINFEAKSFTSIEDNNLLEARIWSDLEAQANQYPQTEASSCGAIAVLNILKALNYDFNFDNVVSQVKYNKRDETASVAQYLFSRSIAGMNAQELIENVTRVTNGTITGRFFSFYPQRDIDLLTWLKSWIAKGAVPVALLNLQKTPIWGFIPDAWHHQMIYACDDTYVYLTNPIETKTSDALMKELTSDSILLIRTYDILKRFNQENSDLNKLINHQDSRWLQMNVLGQIIHVLRTHSMSIQSSTVIDPTIQRANHLTTHIEIPASYQAGITFFVYKDSNLYKELLDTNELPILK